MPNTPLPFAVMSTDNMSRNFAASRNVSTVSLGRSEDLYYPDSGGGRQTNVWSTTRTIVVAGLGIFILVALLVPSHPAARPIRDEFAIRHVRDPAAAL